MARSIPPGSAERTMRIGGHALKVFTYKPVGYRKGPLLVVFHGMNRDADNYRDHAKSIADRFGMVVAAPKFDLENFSMVLYQRAGIVYRNALRPREQWTTTVALRLIDAIRRGEGRPNLDHYLLGHSAGGQFLCRLVAFLPVAARRVVLANPGTWVFPNDADFPFGFGGRTAPLAGEETLKRYLALPLTVYLGDEDLDGANLTTGAAMFQGKTRYARGRKFFAAGKALARQKRWPFNWRLVTVPGVGHSGELMFASARIKQALFG
jgi:pimeloyl-ACP methyl ester carboxylesterase